MTIGLTCSSAALNAQADKPRPAPSAAPAAATLDAPAQEEFLRSAKVVSSRKIGKGITGALRLTLSDGRITHDAAFQAVDEKSSLEDLRQGKKRAGERLFVDAYRYNVAAYQLATLLGLGHMTPTTIERPVDGRRGALSWWIDDVLMDEEEREKKGLQSPSALTLNHKRQRMFVFAELVYDTDRNKGNVLYTKDWDVIMLDFTRAFRLHDTLRAPDGLQLIDRALFQRLQELTPDDLKRVTRDWLTDQERAAIMKRRDLIVSRFQGLIRERGEAKVLY
ncbi:MAG: hypothetical protein LC791_13940 [Acidobacteria bacterium]|nr:hypothetical protein [Acidobacteriota bacterium]